MDKNKPNQTTTDFRKENANLPVIKRSQKFVRYSPIVEQYLENFQYKTKNFLK